MNTHEIIPEDAVEAGSTSQLKPEQEFLDSRLKYEDEKRRIGQYLEMIDRGEVAADGEFNFDIGRFHAEIVIDTLGKVSFNLFEGDRLALGQENTDLETVYGNIESIAFAQDALEEQEPSSSNEMEVVSGAEVLGSQGAKYLEQAVRDRMKEQGGVVGALAEVDPAALTEQGREKLGELEALYIEERDHIQELAAKSKLGIVGAALERVLEFLDLNTREKVFAATLEVVPYVGAVYAVTGKRLVFDRSESGAPIPKLEDISWTDRGLYLAGELLISGHVLRGIKQAVLSKGAKEFAKATGKIVAKKTGQVIVKRAQRGAREEVSKLTGQTAA